MTGSDPLLTQETLLCKKEVLLIMLPSWQIYEHIKPFVWHKFLFCQMFLRILSVNGYIDF